MKKLKMIFAIVFCLVLVIGVLYMPAGAGDAYNSVPAMADTSEGFVIFEGAAFAGTFGNTAITEQGHLPGYSPAQKTFAAGSVSDYGCFEFDFYIDDISIIASRNVKLYLNLRSGTGNGTSKGIYEFQKQLTVNGWNHVAVTTNLDDGILEILTMTRFYIDIDGGSTGATDRYRVANICATNNSNDGSPEISSSKGVYVMGKGVKIKGTLGTSELTGQAHLPGYSSATPAEIQFTNPGLAEYEYFEFDYYTDDIANFNKRAVKLYFNVRTDTVSKGTFEFGNQITASGWNHVKIAADLDADKLNSIIKARFYMDIDAGNAGANDNYMIANICATRDLYNAVPKISQSVGVFEIYTGAKFEGVLGNSKKTGQAHLSGYSSDNPSEIQFTNPGLAEYDFFEFDYYADDIDTFVARNVKLYFNIYNSKNSSLGTFEFGDQIIENGWNNVRIAVSLSADKLNSITKVGFYMDINAGETGKTDRYRIANICAAKDLYDIVPQMIQSEDMFVIGSGVLIEGTLGSSALTGQAHLPGYSSGSPAEVQFTNPGLSGRGCFEFDFYIDRIADLDVRNIKLYLNVRAANNASLGTFEFRDQITESGWNHVRVAADMDDDKLDKITKARFYIDIDAGETGEADRYRIANICAAKDPFGVVPEMVSSDDIVVIAEGAKIQGVFGNSLLTGQAHLPGYHSANPAQVSFENPGLTDHGCFEFDFYVDDIEIFQKRAAKLYFNIRDNNASRGTFEFQKQITQSGWNHVKIDASLDHDLLNSITIVRFYMDINAGSAGASDRYRVANIFASEFVVPDLPDNVVARIGTLKSATLGEYFHTAENRLYEEKLKTVDFSKATAIEFDLYIDDYEALLAAEKASAENYSGLPYARESKLALYLSSTPANLWQQYTKPRKYFSVRIPLSDKITHNGWNHIIVGKGDFSANSQTIDWANLTGWMVAFIYGSDAHQEVNPYPNVTVSICNIVNTGVVSDVPKDSDKSAFPDKNAVYISNAEALSDANGTWNPGSVYISNDYKSEGKASVALDLNYHSLAQDANIYYLFDETVDMRDLKTLKFDFFIDLSQFIKANGNKAEMIIANRRNETNDCYKWNLDFSKLKAGWNSFELNMDSVTVSGKPDLSKCKVIMLRFTELNLDAKVFAQIVIGIDNLRYLSSSGSTKLKINGDSGGFDDQNDNYDVFFDVDHEIEDSVVEQETTDFVSEPQIKYLKTIKKITVPDYLTSGIVLASEAVIALAGVVTFILIYRKRKKRIHV